MKLFKRLFCRHEYNFKRNIYGDEINAVSLSKVYRSWWKCKKCGKLQPRNKLNRDNQWDLDEL